MNFKMCNYWLDKVIKIWKTEKGENSKIWGVFLGGFVNACLNVNFCGVKFVRKSA